MTAPNKIAPMPEPGGEQAPMPTFVAPTPSFSQKASMRLAGLALGLGRNADPSQTQEVLATNLGGYEKVEDPNRDGGFRYKNRDRDPQFGYTKGDETATPSPRREYKTASDFHEEGNGLDLSSAVSRTINGQRTVERPLTAREKWAKKLVARGTKGGHFRPQE